MSIDPLSGPLNLLSLAMLFMLPDAVRSESIYFVDGGGVRGFSELVILHEVMKRIQNVAKLDQLPRPKDYFHMIGGTGTGG